MTQHWLIMNTEAFSASGMKEADHIDSSFLPRVLKLFLSVFHYPYIILDESSKIKTNTPMAEKKKSSRCRLIKLLCETGERTIMTGTLKSKSPLNVYDQVGFLDPGVFTENMYEMAERYQVMETIRIGRGRRVCISQKDYARVRTRLVNANKRGDFALQNSLSSIFRENTISEENLMHIMSHKDYTPAIRQNELARRIEPFTMVVKREDVFDTSFERFVINPIVRYSEPTKEQARLVRSLVDLGFTENLTLGRVPALELMHRIQDICNGFEPIEHREGEDRTISFKPLKDSPKLDALMELIDEIDSDENQIALFSARTNFTEAIMKALDDGGITYAHYVDGNKEEAEKAFAMGQAQIFLSNIQPSAYGLNCLSKCSYSIYACLDHKAETFYQSQHRLLRGQLTAPKFAYQLCVRGSIEERIIKSLRAGMDLINDANSKDTFELKAGA